MTIHNILDELLRGLWYIFVSAPAEINETGASRALLVLLSLIAFFQFGFWYSALLYMLFPRFRKNKQLNTISYFNVSIVAFFVCLIEYVVFENLFIGGLLGFVVSPVFFNYKLYVKKELLLKRIGVGGIVLGFVVGILVSRQFFSDPGYFAYPVFATIGACLGWVFAFYFAIGLVRVFKIYDKEEKQYNKWKQLEKEQTNRRERIAEQHEREAKREDDRKKEVQRVDQEKQRRLQQEITRLQGIATEARVRRLREERQAEAKRQDERGRIARAPLNTSFAPTSTKKYLVFDTETSGLPRNYNAPAPDINNWPRLVQLAFALYDEHRNLIKKESFIIKPNGFNISSQAIAIHNISTERAQREGILLSTGLDKFVDVLTQADYVIGHNVSFDENIMTSELIRAGRSNKFIGKRKICTMKDTTNYCRIPSTNGYGGYKWPSLIELHQKLFNSGFSNSHSANADVDATAKCYWKLRELNVFNV